MKFDNKVAYELELEEPDEELLEWAKNNIGEDPEKKCQLIEELRDMIFEKGECMPHRTDDVFLVRFLRARHFIVRAAYKLLVRYCEFREDNPDLFDGVDLNELTRMGEDSIIVVPPYWESSGRRMILYRAQNWDPDKYTVDHLFQATLALLEVSVLEERTQIMGGIAIFDFKKLSMQQARYCTPNIAKIVFQLMVTSFPLQIHAIHIMHQSYVFDVIYKLFKPFLNKMMKKRIFFHGDDFESLHKHVSPKTLPQRYGGVHPDYNYQDWIKYIRSNDKVMNELKLLGYVDGAAEEVDEVTKF